MANRKVTIVKAATSNSSNATSGSLGIISKKLQTLSEITPLIGIAEDESLQGNANKDVGDLNDTSASSTPRSQASDDLSRHQQDIVFQITGKTPWMNYFLSEYNLSFIDRLTLFHKKDAD
ncbi:hypothetical protein DH2020_010970 [Rehmannia glutinosa]|uniref:Uncharacterized protein n=1 Tax=Rehmannia glutinosa TaxID=99300 RepID=A0ABR0XC22_REHGL